MYAAPLPTSLTPSKVSSFKDCALAFRYSNIDRLPEPPSPWLRRNARPSCARVAVWMLAGVVAARTWAWPAAASHRPPRSLRIGQIARDGRRCRGRVSAHAEVLLRNDDQIQDPDSITVLGTEIQMEARLLDDDIARKDRPVSSTMQTRRDRLQDRQGARPGEKVVVWAAIHSRDRVKNCLAVDPTAFKLLHLREPVCISTEPSDQRISRALRTKATAVWKAVESACSAEDFGAQTWPVVQLVRVQGVLSGLGGVAGAAAERPHFALRVESPKNLAEHVLLSPSPSTTKQVEELDARVDAFFETLRQKPRARPFVLHRLDRRRSRHDLGCSRRGSRVSAAVETAWPCV